MEVTEIYNEFHQTLGGFIRKRVSNKDDAEDILQDVYLKIVNGIGKVKAREKIAGWIFAVARNSITDYYRRHANNGTTEIPESLSTYIATDAGDDTTKGLDECLQHFIGELPEEYRDIIIESELKGVRQKDLAGKYNLEYPSLRSRVQRGRSRLKSMILNCCDIEADTRGNIMEMTRKNDCGDACGAC